MGEGKKSNNSSCPKAIDGLVKKINKTGPRAEHLNQFKNTSFFYPRGKLIVVTHIIHES